MAARGARSAPCSPGAWRRAARPSAGRSSTPLASPPAGSTSASPAPPTGRASGPGAGGPASSSPRSANLAPLAFVSPDQRIDWYVGAATTVIGDRAAARSRRSTWSATRAALRAESGRRRIPPAISARCWPTRKRTLVRDAQNQADGRRWWYARRERRAQRRGRPVPGARLPPLAGRRVQRRLGHRDRRGDHLHPADLQHRRPRQLSHRGRSGDRRAERPVRRASWSRLRSDARPPRGRSRAFEKCDIPAGIPQKTADPSWPLQAIFLGLGRPSICKQIARDRGAQVKVGVALSLLGGLLAGLACELPPSTVNSTTPTVAYLSDPAYARAELTASLVNPGNGYSALRLAHYATGDAADWDRLPEWNPPAEPIAAGELDAPGGASPAALSASAAPLALPASVSSSDDPALLALGEAAFARYPAQLAPYLSVALDLARGRRRLRALGRPGARGRGARARADGRRLGGAGVDLLDAATRSPAADGAHRAGRAQRRARSRRRDPGRAGDPGGAVAGSPRRVGARAPRRHDRGGDRAGAHSGSAARPVPHATCSRTPPCARAI